ncbi:protein phosphatase 2C domain-containing protein [candidate division KSB1 bacterium]|nr:protein phosphatase 2C domain-containing protein [candidate division KSB1 bacterium]
MPDINLNIPYAKIIPETSLRRFTTYLLEPEENDQRLSVGTLVADRYEIKAVLPRIGELKCYSVFDLLNSSRCGVCGNESNSNMDSYCDRCGFFMADNKYLLLGGTQQQTIAFDQLIRKAFEHQGVLKIFDKFYHRKTYFIVGQSLENMTLENFYGNLQFDQIRDWLIVLFKALDLLHQHRIFNIGLAPSDIFLAADGPKLVNFSNSVIRRAEADRWIRFDMKNLARTFLTILSKRRFQSDCFSFLKSILIKAFHQVYLNGSEFIHDLVELTPEIKELSCLKDSKTILLGDRGVSISVGMASDVGMIRQLNEDSVGALELTNILQSVSRPCGFYMVADGMGGHEAGEEASKIAVEHITSKIIQTLDDNEARSGDEIRLLLEEAVFSANEEIFEQAKSKNNNMGTTITVAYFANDRAYILNIGDARAYLFSQNKLKLLTQDHSLVFRLHKIGQLKYDEIAGHPQSHQILCALGEPNLKHSLDNLRDKSKHPYFFQIKLERGDGLLLCTDGLWQMIQDSQMEQILCNHSQPQSAVDEMVKLANQNGGDDNISLIFVKTQ